MKSYDFYAVTFDADCWCVECVPEHNHGDESCEECSPIFADSECDSYPVCGNCGTVHTYVSLTSDGYRTEFERHRHEWHSSLYNFSLTLTGDDVLSCSQRGDNEDNVSALRRVAYVREQLNALDPDAVRCELRESGAWDAEELTDDDANLSRLLWIACCDLRKEFTRGDFDPSVNY